VASVEVPPFMAIHYINAYEDDIDGAAVVIVDCCEHYSDPATRFSTNSDYPHSWTSIFIIYTS
jgi:carotenoid cleavage dioxygenase-like enzyme